jgi:hypothetical protein
MTEDSITIGEPSWPTIVGKVIEPPEVPPLPRPRGAQRGRTEKRVRVVRRVVKDDE